MSNGVEVIVAGDKSTLPGSPNQLNNFRILPSSVYKNQHHHTLPPTTLKDHMLLMMPNRDEVCVHFLFPS